MLRLAFLATLGANLGFQTMRSGSRGLFGLPVPVLATLGANLGFGALADGASAAVCNHVSMRILFVCLGNICRSPLAEVVFASHLVQEGLDDHVSVDSAGTAGYHAGEAADRRSRACAQRHGLAITHRARAVVPSDFRTFDLLVAMDSDNAAELRRRAPDAASRAKVRLMRDWDPAGGGDVPDPYYGDEGDFEQVWHLCDRSSPGLVAFLKEKHSW